ncbi:MAG: 16S rRNA (cytidine(1402)-2'-O)-methyltransferase [Pseudomonadota bacterium]
MPTRPPSPLRRPLAPGLHLVSTPIGAANDITLRALDVLAQADVLAAEDTRTLRKLMDLHGVALAGRRIVAYHDHNGASARPGLLAALKEGKTVAYASEAGTPMVADPGLTLARATIEAGVAVQAAPGASALLAALAVAGLPTDRFFFAGFAPTKDGARRRFLEAVVAVDATLVLYESPKRLAKLLAALEEASQGGRACVVCRELTKKFEETRRGTLAELRQFYDENEEVKGEIVVLLGPPEHIAPSEEEVDEMLVRHLLSESVKDAASEVARATGLPRRALYARAQELKDKT